MKQIPIFFTFDRYYAVPAAVAFYSLLRHAAPLYQYNLYVLHTSIPQAIQKRLTRLVKRFPNADLQFVDVSHFDGQGDIGQGKSHFSKEIYYKLIAAEIFPQYDRILCSDVDVVFTGDISPSYFLFPDEDFYYAGVGQVLESGRMKAYADDLFSPQEKQALEQELMAGYLLFNLKAIRRDGMLERLTDFYRRNYHRLPLPEQDCLALCCGPRVRHLPMEYVVCNTYYKPFSRGDVHFVSTSRWLPEGEAERLAMFTRALARPVQVHYVGPLKPWNSLQVPKRGLWFACLREAGLTASYLRMLPAFIRQRLGRYSLRRFFTKIYCKLTHQPYGNNR